MVIGRIVVSEYGSDDILTEQEGVALFQLKGEFDGQPVTNGIVTLSYGGHAIWNPETSRWEYRETSDDEGNITLTVESVFLSKFGLTTLHPDAEHKHVTIRWKQPPWYYPFVTPAIQTYKFVLAFPLLAWGTIGTGVIFVALIKLEVLKIKIEKPSEPAEELNEKIDRFLKPLINNNNQYLLFQHFLYQLLKEDLSPLNSRIPEKKPSLNY